MYSRFVTCSQTHFWEAVVVVSFSIPHHKGCFDSQNLQWFTFMSYVYTGTLSFHTDASRSASISSQRFIMSSLNPLVGHRGVMMEKSVIRFIHHSLSLASRTSVDHTRKIWTQRMDSAAPYTRTARYILLLRVGCFLNGKLWLGGSLFNLHLFFISNCQGIFKVHIHTGPLSF